MTQRHRGGMPKEMDWATTMFIQIKKPHDGAVS